MDKITAGLIGAVAGLATMGCAHAATTSPAAPDALQASSYADLLTPVSNAVALLKADDAARLQTETSGVQRADWDNGDWYEGERRPYYDHHHHHHHHHNYYSRDEHHHHHHQQYGNYVGIPGVGGFVVGR